MKREVRRLLTVKEIIEDIKTIMISEGDNSRGITVYDNDISDMNSLLKIGSIHINLEKDIVDFESSAFTLENIEKLIVVSLDLEEDNIIGIFIDSNPIRRVGNMNIGTFIANVKGIDKYYYEKFANFHISKYMYDKIRYIVNTMDSPCVKLDDCDLIVYMDKLAELPIGSIDNSEVDLLLSCIVYDDDKMYYNRLVMNNGCSVEYIKFSLLYEYNDTDIIKTYDNNIAINAGPRIALDSTVFQIKMMKDAYINDMKIRKNKEISDKLMNNIMFTSASMNQMPIHNNPNPFPMNPMFMRNNQNPFMD